jgi:hypothetical protein
VPMICDLLPTDLQVLRLDADLLQAGRQVLYLTADLTRRETR